jgi:hypothetical protein
MNGRSWSHLQSRGPYFVETKNGRMFTGRTGPDGLLRSDATLDRRHFARAPLRFPMGLVGSRPIEADPILGGHVKRFAVGIAGTIYGLLLMLTCQFAVDAVLRSSHAARTAGATSWAKVR